MKEIISRQLKWQRKMMEQGRCIICGKPAIPNGKHCVRCWLNQHIKYAKKKNSTKFKNSRNVRMLQLLVNEDWERKRGEVKIEKCSTFSCVCTKKKFNIRWNK
ncbi:hypothetical protein DRN85_08565 [Methanosarcinales archaeon]|nr:MAG: hypothetical protein DRN85_08565 [Methanosarcinales archaeon]